MVELWGFGFEFVCIIEPDLDESGAPREFMPQSRYNNISNLPLNFYGIGPFCRFRIPNFLTQAGVYAVYDDVDLVYIGECENLSKRWNNQYGNISPRNCFLVGRSTNCRVNNLILKAFKSGHNIKLFFHETTSRKRVEDFLIGKYNPKWNIQKSKRVCIHEGGLHSSVRFDYKKSTIASAKGKYQKLEEYLKCSKKKIEKLTYEEMERIIGTHLPSSAYRHRPWWANSGHSQSTSWSNANWKVLSVELGKTVTFGITN